MYMATNTHSNILVSTPPGALTPPHQLTSESQCSGCQQRVCFHLVPSFAPSVAPWAAPVTFSLAAVALSWAVYEGV